MLRLRSPVKCRGLMGKFTWVGAPRLNQKANPRKSEREAATIRGKFRKVAAVEPI